jgi:hypothetical protein
MKTIDEILDDVKIEQLSLDMLKAGDILVISIPQRVDKEYVDKIREDFRTVIPEENPILILTGGITLSVLGSDAWIE